VDGLRGGGGALAFHAGVIVLLAALHAVARLGSRFTMLGAEQWVEHDVGRDLYAHLETLSPAFYLTHRTGRVESVDSINLPIYHGGPIPNARWRRQVVAYRWSAPEAPEVLRAGPVPVAEGATAPDKRRYYLGVRVIRC